MFRISYPEAINITAVDCLTMHRVCLGSEFFTYEDDGWPYWYEDEEHENLLDVGPISCTERGLENEVGTGSSEVRG